MSKGALDYLLAIYKGKLMRINNKITSMEMIVVATSAANGCQYCVVAHGALLCVFAKEPLLADQIAVNYLHAPISPK